MFDVLESVESAIGHGAREPDLQSCGEASTDWRSPVAMCWLHTCMARKQRAEERALLACAESKRIALRESEAADSRLLDKLLDEIDHQFAIAVVGAAMHGESMGLEARELKLSLLTIGASSSARSRNDSAGHARRAEWLFAVRRTEQISIGLLTTHLIARAVNDLQQGRLSPMAYLLNMNLERGNATLSTLIVLRSIAQPFASPLRC